MVTDKSQAEWIESSQGLVRALATRIHKKLPPSVSLEDVLAYGQLGLMQAVQAFRSDQGTSFQTFAYYRIRGAIYDGLAKMAWTSRAAQQRWAAQRASAAVMDEAAEDAPTEGADKSAGAGAEWLVRTTERLVVVQLLTGQGTEASGGAESIPDQHQFPPDQRAEQRELEELLRRRVQSLPDVERRLIELTYYEDHSLAEAARILGKSKSWASRLHVQILERLARSVRVAELR